MLSTPLCRFSVVECSFLPLGSGRETRLPPLARGIRHREKQNSSRDLNIHITYIIACVPHGSGVALPRHRRGKRGQRGDDVLNTTRRSGAEPEVWGPGLISATRFVGPRAKLKCRASRFKKKIKHRKMATAEHETKQGALPRARPCATAQVTLLWSQPCSVDTHILTGERSSPQIIEIPPSCRWGMLWRQDHI